MGIVVDWFLDPLALLFLSSLAFGTAGVAAGPGRDRRGRRARARRAVALAFWTGGFLVASAPAIVNPLVAALEGRHPAGTECPSGTPVIVLGGGVDSRVRDAEEYERMRPATLARTAAAERIARDEPGVTLVLSGGGLGGDASRVPEAAVMARLLESRGADPGTLVTETGSGDTAGNAREVARLLAARGASGEARLVTSALHMARALATFRTAGVDVCPVPVAPIAIEDVPPWALMPQTTALVKFDRLLHELLALVAYRLRGDL